MASEMMRDAQTAEGVREIITEQEWTDQFGTHYEVRGRRGNVIVEQKVTRSPATGWAPERERAWANVVAAMTRIPADEEPTNA